MSGALWRAGATAAGLVQQRLERLNLGRQQRLGWHGRADGFFHIGKPDGLEIGRRGLQLRQLVALPDDAGRASWLPIQMKWMAGAAAGGGVWAVAGCIAPQTAARVSADCAIQLSMGRVTFVGLLVEWWSMPSGCFQVHVNVCKVA